MKERNNMMLRIKVFLKHLRKKYKTNKISIMKDTTGNKKWMAI